jgi:hypothetical protein
LIKQNDPVKKANDYVRFSSMAFQMIIIIGIGTWLGYKLDHWLHLHLPIFTTILAFLSVIGAIAYFIREALKK